MDIPVSKPPKKAHRSIQTLDALHPYAALHCWLVHLPLHCSLVLPWSLGRPPRDGWSWGMAVGVPAVVSPGRCGGSAGGAASSASPCDKCRTGRVDKKDSTMCSVPDDLKWSATHINNYSWTSDYTLQPTTSSMWILNFMLTVFWLFAVISRVDTEELHGTSTWTATSSNRLGIGNAWKSHEKPRKARPKPGRCLRLFSGFLRLRGHQCSGLPILPAPGDREQLALASPFRVFLVTIDRYWRWSAGTACSLRKSCCDGCEAFGALWERFLGLLFHVKVTYYRFHFDPFCSFHKMMLWVLSIVCWIELPGKSWLKMEMTTGTMAFI